MFRCTSYLEMLSYYAVFLILVSVHMLNASDDGEYIKQKRSYNGLTGLVPFPRTGRSDPDAMNWDNGYNSFEEYEEYPHMEVKRQGLIPFPRVGRSGIAQKYLTKSNGVQGYKRGVPGAGNGMWFGPRLGRIQKRNSDGARDAMQESRSDVYTPRLGRESGELFDDYDMYYAISPDTERKNLMRFFS